MNAKCSLHQLTKVNQFGVFLFGSKDSIETKVVYPTRTLSAGKKERRFQFNWLLSIASHGLLWNSVGKKYSNACKGGHSDFLKLVKGRRKKSRRFAVFVRRISLPFPCGNDVMQSYENTFETGRFTDMMSLTNEINWQSNEHQKQPRKMWISVVSKIRSEMPIRSQKWRIWSDSDICDRNWQSANYQLVVVSAQKENLQLTVKSSPNVKKVTELRKKIWPFKDENDRKVTRTDSFLS